MVFNKTQRNDKHCEKTSPVRAVFVSLALFGAIRATLDIIDGVYFYTGMVEPGAYFGKSVDPISTMGGGQSMPLTLPLAPDLSSTFI